MKPPPKTSRPLSPHLQIYSWEWTMFYSIVHRFSGVALSIGALFMVWWIVSLALGSESFLYTQLFFGSVIGRVMLLGWTWALFYHLLNGCRHLLWDCGFLFGLGIARWSGHLGFLLSIVLTILFWLIGYGVI